MKCYCIGGPQDGEMIHVTDDTDCVDFPTSDFGAIRYKRHQLASPNEVFNILIPNDWTLDKAMEHILQNYSDMAETIKNSNL